MPLTAASPAKDLDDVLGRFHAWSNAHKETHKGKEVTKGVREVSYEEALESTRRRWQTHNATSSPSAKNETLPVSVRFTDEIIAPDKVALSNATEQSPRGSTTAREPLTASFGTVLSEAVSPEASTGALALFWPAANRSERQVSISFRVAASEQALIKARAAEAGLSVSAYLRQCALEVEKLRAQVQHTLALIEQRSQQNSLLPSSAASSAPAPEGFLARLRQRIFGPQPGSRSGPRIIAGWLRPPTPAG